MPIRALCTICSDLFDHSRDVAAIHCGHTFHLQCLIQWFETAPRQTCPQCRIQVGKRTIINKLFFDLAQEEETALDAEFLKNELDNIKAQLSQKEKEKRDSQVIIDTLRDTLEERNATVESLQNALDKAEMLCSTLKKQMKYLEQQQDETKQAQEEARRLRNKIKAMERIELLLQSQRPEVEEMIRDMGVGQSAVEQLAVYCISLKKEYENLKEVRKASGELADKLRKDLVLSKNKFQTVCSELDQTKLELKSAQKDLQNADKEITSLRKKLTMLQETLNLTPVANETVNRLVLESPAPVEMLKPKLHRPPFHNAIDLDATFDVNTPPAQPSGSQHGRSKKLCLEKAHSPVQDIHRKMPKVSTQESQLSLGGQRCVGEPDEELARAFPVFIQKAILGQKQPKRTIAESCRSTDVVRTGFDGLGGRTKFIQPTDTAVIHPLPIKPKAKTKQRVRVKTVQPPSQTKLDTFLW
ncbi:TRAF-interacting protein [Heterocephalus glaber]|uniref:E3 ubiquitin-protein ligase TRAIP isoform X1 n=1 Tax=Heterocephalus glaber TaxID=10181 RepID=G5BZX6_HETGA|nr:E3 ubiquitin-protein ligase TRAIP isoform X1 [Heterocephalus glaber]EHB14818.1 TRAF-interacting protein [Heterocephalus glaber]